jgi:predicted MFS family arabinose efflux permease
VLIVSDVVLAHGSHWPTVLLGVILWGLHMGLTQGLLATMVAQVAPPELKGTAFGFFNLTSGLEQAQRSMQALDSASRR